MDVTVMEQEEPYSPLLLSLAISVSSTPALPIMVEPSMPLLVQQLSLYHLRHPHSLTVDRVTMGLPSIPPSLSSVLTATSLHVMVGTWEKQYLQILVLQLKVLLALPAHSMNAMVMDLGVPSIFILQVENLPLPLPVYHPAPSFDVITNMVEPYALPLLSYASLVPSRSAMQVTMEEQYT